MKRRMMTLHGAAQLEAIRLASDELDLARRNLQAKVDRARAAGVPWSAIADVWGVSRQAVWERFGRKVDK